MRIEMGDQEPRRDPSRSGALVRRVVFAVAALTSGAALLAGCPGTLDDKEKFTTTGGPGECPEITAYLKTNCGGSGCHGAMLPASNLDLESPGVEERIADKAGMCAGLIANTSDPEASLLYTKLLNPPGCNAQMPFLREELPSNEINCILLWLDTIAPGTPVDAGTQDAADDGPEDAAMD
jgi:hypothetical protein